MKNTYDKIPAKKRINRWSARQRKKFRVKEFQQLIFRVSIVFKEALIDKSFDKFIDGLIECVEANDLCLGAFGGKLPIKETVGVIDTMSRRNPTKADRKLISAYLHKDPNIENVVVGELRDANYGWN